ncbi:hypothetical protein EB796_006130 [Bugula neritina]|uniref:Uncharacterized protein n=1 Tax=Bugula neritina TaxID=10212 RepID=A0A7J7KA83_BUGNE|nr:hypothetical protein EB796_006130 [Bugula neritina]
MADWKNGLFGCFGNCKVCLVSYVVPCYAFGKTHEKVEEGSCVKCGCASMVPLLNWYAFAKQRQLVREKQGIDGSFGGDCVSSLFCPFCAMVQQAREVEADLPGLPEIERA